MSDKEIDIQAIAEVLLKRVDTLRVQSLEEGIFYQGCAVGIKEFFNLIKKHADGGEGEGNGSNSLASEDGAKLPKEERANEDTPTLEIGS